MNEQERISRLLRVAESIKNGEPVVEYTPDDTGDDLARLSRVIRDLGENSARLSKESQLLLQITEKINAGRVLDEVLDFAFNELYRVLPYDRIGFSLLEDDDKTVRAVWARSRNTKILLQNGYSAPLGGSSLEAIITSGRPRVINDLPQYFAEHPNSASTKLILEEGICSSLTCPLLALGKPIGFIFFSSRKKNTYQNAHIDLFAQIAGQLAIIAEKGQLYQRLLRLDDLKNKFLGMAAHDLRSPLTVIKGNLDLLYDGLLGDVNPSQAEAIDKMRLYCKSMLALINDLLSISVIESGKLALKKVDTVIKTFIDDLISFNRLMAIAKQIDLQVELAGELPETLRMDPNRIGQVVNNLIGNAIKFSSPRTKILFRIEKVLGSVKFSIIDQGQGIPPKEIPKLFHFFSRTSTSSTQGEPSTGLGLAIVKRLVDAHGGQVTVESTMHKGTTFSFSLPL
jgi:signal transduction histidine kinase